MLVKLKARFGPTDKTRRAEMLIKYRKIQKAPRIKSLEPWLHEWEMIYHNAVELNLPDVAEDRVTMDFLRSIQNVNPGFLAYWIHNTEVTDIYPTLYKIIQKFRIHIRQNPEQKLASHRTFATTSQGHGQTTENGSNDVGNKTTFNKKCVCGEIHRFKDCPYLVKLKRPHGWTPKPDLQKTIDKDPKEYKTPRADRTSKKECKRRTNGAKPGRNH